MSSTYHTKYYYLHGQGGCCRLYTRSYSRHPTVVALDGGRCLVVDALPVVSPLPVQNSSPAVLHAALALIPEQRVHSVIPGTADVHIRQQCTSTAVHCCTAVVLLYRVRWCSNQRSRLLHRNLTLYSTAVDFHCCTRILLYCL